MTATGLGLEIGPDGERARTRHAEGYFRLLVDWIRTGRLDASTGYGRARFLTGRGAAAR